jgi:hypothetical protein
VPLLAAYSCTDAGIELVVSGDLVGRIQAQRATRR